MKDEQPGHADEVTTKICIPDWERIWWRNESRWTVRDMSMFRSAWQLVKRNHETEISWADDASLTEISVRACLLIDNPHFSLELWLSNNVCNCLFPSADLTFLIKCCTNSQTAGSDSLNAVAEFTVSVQSSRNISTKKAILINEQYQQWWIKTRSLHILHSRFLSTVHLFSTA